MYDHFYINVYMWRDAVGLRESSYRLHVANFWKLFCADIENTGADPVIILGQQNGRAVRKM